MDRKNRQQWIKDVLAKQIVDTYLPWKGSQIAGCDVEHIEGKKDNFASTTYAITIRLRKGEDGSEEYLSQSLFLKFIVDEQVVREALHSENQFHNEIMWYSKVVPRFDSLIKEAGIGDWDCDIFPKCFYAFYDADDAVVALEDLRPKKFQLGDRYCLDVKHVEKALETIARSHALAYKWREVDEGSFNEVAGTFKESTLNEQLDDTLKACNSRVMKALEKDPAYKDRLLKFKEITVNPYKLMRFFAKPKNNLATLCHGDFCRNNMLFSEGSENGNSTVDIKLIDFQTVRYASPAIDLSFFFFLSTTPEFRAKEFDRLFELYHNTLLKTLKALSPNEKPEYIKNLENVFSLQAFKDDFAKHALYGYFITAFFLPVMLVDDKTREEMSQLWEANDDRHVDMLANMGGENVTKQLVETLKEILDRGYWPILENKP